MTRSSELSLLPMTATTTTVAIRRDRGTKQRRPGIGSSGHRLSVGDPPCSAPAPALWSCSAALTSPQPALDPLLDSVPGRELSSGPLDTRDRRAGWPARPLCAQLSTPPPVACPKHGIAQEDTARARHSAGTARHGIAPARHGTDGGYVEHGRRSPDTHPSRAKRDLSQRT